LTPEELARLSVAQFGARVILEQLDRIRRHERGTRRGRDPEELHKMRVATRRLRVAFRTFARPLAKTGAGYLPEAEARQVADALGEVRDLDVFAEWLTAQAASADAGTEDAAAALLRLRDERLSRRKLARKRMIEALNGPALAALSDDLRQRMLAIYDPASETTDPALDIEPGLDAGGVKKKKSKKKRVPKRRRVGRAGRKLIARALKQLHKRGDSLFAPAEIDLHRVRIGAKRFRYVCEFLAPAYGVALDEAIARATAVQDSLGELHDAQVATAALLADVQRVASSADSEDAGPIAHLIAAQHARAATALEQFRTQWPLIPGRQWAKRIHPAKAQPATGSDQPSDAPSVSTSEDTQT
jgi:triphosphatase